MHEKDNLPEQISLLAASGAAEVNNQEIRHDHPPADGQARLLGDIVDSQGRGPSPESEE